MMAEPRGPRWVVILAIVFILQRTTGGHGEYWKWQAPRTVPWGLEMKAGTNDPEAIQPGNPDIQKSQMGSWGVWVQRVCTIGYIPVLQT